MISRLVKCPSDSEFWCCFVSRLMRQVAALGRSRKSTGVLVVGVLRYPEGRYGRR